jgi:hypothetical protein
MPISKEKKILNKFKSKRFLQKTRKQLPIFAAFALKTFNPARRLFGLPTLLVEMRFIMIVFLITWCCIMRIKTQSQPWSQPLLKILSATTSLLLVLAVDKTFGSPRGQLKPSLQLVTPHKKRRHQQLDHLEFFEIIFSTKMPL